MNIYYKYHIRNITKGLLGSTLSSFGINNDYKQYYSIDSYVNFDTQLYPVNNLTYK